MSYISLYDVAEFAVQALTSEKGVNQTLELGGPEPIAPNDVVKIFEKELGAPIEVTRVPEETLRRQYGEATDEYQKTFAGLMLGAAGGDVIDMKETLRRFPLKLTSVHDYARRSARA